ncbi:MAG: tRNA1(Val) (adenine(37)-N6)-methyltransferase [Bacilli bacterium]|nr:tRNA1(Val) (adenine(37)-N6)-methyltransferase [Bacilli bacterium]
MEVINDLVGYDKLKIYQNTDWFKFSLDSILLAEFATINLNTKKIMDFCTGNAPIPLILSKKTTSIIYGVEIQKDVFELANKSVKFNGLENQIYLYNVDLNELKDNFTSDCFDLITCNPPYFKYNEDSHVNFDTHKLIARHEYLVNLDNIIDMSYYLLKSNGRLSLVHRAERLQEIMIKLNNKKFQIKKIQFVHSKINSIGEMVLIEASKNGNPGLKILSPIVIYDENNNYSSFFKKIYNGGESDDTKEL